jgi:NADPH:quinone reductase-like Zn-dependent oxidoreductase
MRAWVVTRYGGPEVLELREVPTPVPAAGEVLVRVGATTVTAGDRRVRAMEAPRGFGLIFPLVFGRGRPKQPVMGGEASGVVEAVGAGVTRFKPGDRVFAYSDMKLGAHAEFLLAPEAKSIAQIPDGVSFEDAATLCFGPCTALAFLRKAKVKAGDRVLVNGASGGVGSATVQLAHYMGASVTALTSAGNADLARSIGAADVIDYKAQDFAALGRQWDVIVDTVGNLSYAGGRPALAKGGRLALVAADLPATLAAPFQSFGAHKVIAGPTGGSREDLELVAGLVAAGNYKPVIDRVLPFAQMREAHRIADSGRKRGSVVLTL